jgi:hypothetical protein
MWGTLSDERKSLAFAIAAGPRQRSHSCVRIPRDSWPYLILSDSRFPNLVGQVPVFISSRYRVAWLCPQALGSLLVASYDSQVYGRDIGTRLHAGNSTHWIDYSGNFAVYPWQGPHRKHSHYCWNVFTETSLRKGHSADHIENSLSIVAQSLLWYVFTGLLSSNGRRLFLYAGWLEHVLRFLWLISSCMKQIRHNIFTCMGVRVTMIGFISTLVTISLNYNQYSAIADLHTLQFIVVHILGFSVSTSLLLATELNTETSTWDHYVVFLSFLVQSPLNLGNELRLLFTPPVYCSLPQLTTFSPPSKPSARTYRKHVTWSQSVAWRHCLRGNLFADP